MKVMTIFGTRPEIIRLSQVIKQLDKYCDQILVHTGQNYDPALSDIFFDELDLRSPDVYLGIKAESFADQIGQILIETARLLTEYQPNRVLILGDTNSGLTSIVAARMGIPVFHMEAGNRCYDDRVPEEINRRIIDHCSSVLMPYTHRSKENLLREGIERQRIFVTGNPIYEVLQTYDTKIAGSDILNRFEIARHGYFLATFHRAENVDDAARLKSIIDSFVQLTHQYQEPIIVSLHPRTADKLARFNLLPVSNQIRLVKPVGFADFVALEKNAKCVISDSGTVQEECSILGVPNVTIRDTTERAETIETGSNILAGGRSDDILRAVEIVLSSPSNWSVPTEYLETCVSITVVKIVLGYHQERNRIQIVSE